MHAYTGFTMEFPNGDESTVIKAVSLLGLDPDLLDDFEVEDNKIEIEENYEIVFLEDFRAAAIRIAKKFRNEPFIISGCIDTSESAGEYMDFRIEYDGVSTLLIKNSKWYLVLDPCDFKTFEDFQDTFKDKYTEAEFKEFQGNGGFMIEKDISDSSKNVIVKEVPLEEVEELHYPFR